MSLIAGERRSHRSRLNLRRGVPIRSLAFPHPCCSAIAHLLAADGAERMMGAVSVRPRKVVAIVFDHLIEPFGCNRCRLYPTAGCSRLVDPVAAHVARGDGRIGAGGFRRGDAGDVPQPAGRSGFDRRVERRGTGRGDGAWLEHRRAGPLDHPGLRFRGRRALRAAGLCARPAKRPHRGRHPRCWPASR